MKLIIYDSVRLNEVIEEYSEYTITSFIRIQMQCEKIDEIKEHDFNMWGLDLSNYISDTNVNVYYKTYLEKYILELIKQNDNMIFLLNRNQKDVFLNLYPYLFEEAEVESRLSVVEKSTEEIKTISNQKLRTYVYNNVEDFKNINGDKNNILSFSNIITEFNGINIKFDFESLKEGVVYYLDITSFIQQFDVRTDIIFTYELILNRLSTYSNVFLLLDERALEIAKKCYPYNFEFINLDSDTRELAVEIEDSYLDRIDDLQRGFNSNLIGHNQFKKNMYKKMVAFKYLNEIKSKYIFSIFICGKSGIGKTEVGRQLHKLLFKEEPFIKINFGNYSSEGTLNCLIGSPPGYIGSNEDSELVKKIKRSKSKVIVFDEFERADSSVYNFFYELLEDGQFTDRFGKVYNMNQYIIIFTSNLSEAEYDKLIPKPLRSRFDMRYIFNELSNEDKLNFKAEYISELLGKFLERYPEININEAEIVIDDIELCSYENIRDIKSLIENIVIDVLDKKI